MSEYLGGIHTFINVRHLYVSISLQILLHLIFELLQVRVPNFSVDQFI